METRTPTTARRIYEEEKARDEARRSIGRDRWKRRLRIFGISFVVFIAVVVIVPAVVGSVATQEAERALPPSDEADSSTPGMRVSEELGRWSAVYRVSSEPHLRFRTEPFTVEQAPWAITFESPNEVQVIPGAGIFGWLWIAVKRAGGIAEEIHFTHAAGSPYLVDLTGTFYLDIGTNGKWDLAVVTVPEEPLAQEAQAK